MGAGAFWNPTFPTRDGVIPWRLFLILYSQLDVVWARAQLEQANAIMASLANVLGSEDGTGKRLLDQMIATAFPDSGDTDGKA